MAPKIAAISGWYNSLLFESLLRNGMKRYEKSAALLAIVGEKWKQYMLLRFEAY
jgi:hypothetical protein